MTPSIYKNHVKRICDIIISLMVIMLLLWLYILIYFIVLFKEGSPVIFKQERPGKKGVTFTLYKFRSMSEERDDKGQYLSDAERLNKFGRILRSTSLDELPELYNVLKGDMSLIGPRPLTVEYMKYYNDFEKRRHEVRPGLTGLAQINGRNAATWKERFQNDVEYVDNLSFGLDVKIFLMTLKKIIVREGIEYKNGGTIQDYFNSEDRPKG